MLFGKVEYFEDLFIAFKTYCPEKGGHRKLLLSVEVCIHNIVDVCCKFYPRTFEGYYSCRVQFSPVGMDALTEEYTRRPVQLGDNNTFSAVYDKCAPFSHIRHCSEIDILDNSIEILVFRSGSKLEKLSERFQLNFQKIGIIKLIFPGGKTNSFSIF